MRPRSRPVLVLGLALACQPSQTDTSPFTTMPPTPGTSGSDTSSSSGGSSSTTGGELSAGSGSGDSSTGGATLVLDVGDGGDLGPVEPAGCKGKIDFLFVISRHDYMDAVQAQLADAVPKFLETIQAKFADFDYHIMVVKGDPFWGDPDCDEECPGPFSQWCVAGSDYPCALLGKISECDRAWGAGAVFNAGENAPNKPCEIADGRYLTRDQPDLPAKFACIAQVGTDGGDLLGQALVHAVSPEPNGPGGCNEGFLRDDALLVVTLVTWTADYDSEGTPAEWAQAVRNAKGGDEGSVVMFGIHGKKIGGECLKQDRVCQVAALFPYSHWIDASELDYGPGFDAATDLVATACSAFIPQ